MDQSKEPAGNAGVLETLRVIPFSTYLVVNFLSMVGRWMQRVAVGWLVWTLSGSETVLGIIGGAELIPAIVLAPLAGVMADRVRPSTVVILCTLIAMCQTVTLGLLAATGLATLPLIFALMVVSGIGNGAMEPARASMVYTLVPRHCLPSAVPLDSLVYNTARFVGPAFAGLVLLWLAPEYVVMLSAACSLPMLAIVVWLRRRESKRVAEKAKARLDAAPSNIWQDMKAGFLYVLRDARIAPVVCLLMAMSFFLRPIADMLPPFVARIPGGGATELAMLVSAFGIGALAAGLSITILRRNSRLENWLVGAMLVCAAATIGFVYSESLALSLALAAMAGGGQAVTGIAAKTIMQTVCDPAFRGRVMAAYSTFHLGGPAIGLPFVGALAELIELRLAFVITVLISLGIVVAVVMKKGLGR